MEDNEIILFRGKDIETGGWVEGSLTVFPKHYPCITTVSDASPVPKKSTCTVWPESVGQFIGLQDKKGRMAFFDDIVKFTPKVLNRFGSEYIDARYELLAIIDKDEYNHSVLRILSDKGEFKKGDIYHIDGLENGEVIGNKTDNPELLEE